MTVGVGGRRPHDVPTAERMGWFNQVNAADLVIARRTESGPDQISLVGEQQDGVSVGSQMNAGAILQEGHGIRLPQLSAGARIKANEFAGSLRRIHAVVLQERS